jgi:hypothetical protein
MRALLLLCFVLMIFASCEFGKPYNAAKQEIFKDTVTYTMQKIYQRADDCGDKADSACTVVKVTYPVFKGQSALNDTVTRKLTTLFAVYNKPDSNIAQMAKTFLTSYSDFKKNNPSSAMYYTMDTYMKVVAQDSALITLEYGGYTFQGGAHGASFKGFVNWDPDKKKALYLDDILTANYHDTLTKVAETIFRKEEKLKDTSSLARDYFFKDNKFALNENYLFTPSGIRFVYNQYEIKPYATGQTELLIPWAQIKTLIRPNAVVAPYTKKDAGI